MGEDSGNAGDPVNGDFAAAWNELLENEGGYVDNPADPGGATKYGITERTARRHGYTGDMRDLPLTLAVTIAKTEYWDPVKGDQLPPEVAFQVLDAAYNSGVDRAARWLQKAAKVTEDGDIGTETLAAVSAADPDKIVMRFDAYRLFFLEALPAWPSFAKGWTARIAKNLLRAAG